MGSENKQYIDLETKLFQKYQHMKMFSKPFLIKKNKKGGKKQE